jgi:hypothetical protein
MTVNASNSLTGTGSHHACSIAVTCLASDVSASSGTVPESIFKSSVHCPLAEEFKLETGASGRHPGKARTSRVGTQHALNIGVTHQQTQNPVS